MSRLAKILRLVSLVLAGAGLNAHAGGPLAVSAGCPAKYPGASVTLNYDNGSLGSLGKSAADALVTSAVALWTNVPTATIVFSRGADLPVDVNASNYQTYLNNFGDGLNPVIYDTDGSIIDDYYGTGAKSSVLGFAGSVRSGCNYIEGVALISGYIAISSTQLGVVFAHEMGHLIGLDHTQLDSVQGLGTASYPLMYPIAYRNTLNLHTDDAAAVSALYPHSSVSSTYGEVTGFLRGSNGTTPILGANIWARENTTGALYSVVSDYLVQGTGYFRLLLPAGTYTLRAEAIRSNFTAGSSVGPYSESASSPSFQSPLWVGGVAMTPVTLGGGSPVAIAITAGCSATVSFSLSGAGSVTTSNCAPKTTPTVNLATSLNPANYGQGITFTASVPGTPTATGTMVFRDNGVAISGCAGLAMSGGQAACSPILSAGTHSITAVYSGDVTYNTGTSGTLSQVVNGTTPTVTLGTSQNPSAIGVPVTLTANVSGAAGTASGTVNFLDGASSIPGCSAVALSGGTATCSTPSLGLGAHSITAAYSGSGPYHANTSSALSQTVINPSTPSITLGSTANPSTVGQYVTYTAVVSGAYGTPTGTIVFRDNGVIINGCGGLVMANGRASCTIGNQALGTHSMTAVYSGNGLYSAVTSSTLPQVVNVAKANTPSITLGSSVNPSTVGQYVEFTAVVSGAAGTPTGTLVFLDNGEVISGCGGLPMVNGRATCTFGGLALGSHAITVVYSGSGTYNGVTSSNFPQTVGAAKANTPSLTLGSSQNPSLSGNVVTFTAVLSGPVGTPTGTVVFRENGETISGCGGLALVNGRVSCSPRLNGAGLHAMTAIYLGDGSYNGVTSSTVPQNVQ